MSADPSAGRAHWAAGRSRWVCCRLRPCRWWPRSGSALWPAVRLIRLAFDAGAARTSAALATHVPPGVESRLDITYRPGDPQAVLDIHYPPGALSAGDPLPVVVWTHGGGFVSGDKADITNYAKVLAGRGYAVVSVGYTIAPEAQYPTPVRQLDAALGYLAAHAAGAAPGSVPVRPGRGLAPGPRSPPRSPP